jgi:hypothetical protein
VSRAGQSRVLHWLGATGEDYDDPNCDDTQWLDVSRNRLAGRISTDAALGDDVTDAICSTACISLVLAANVTDEEVLCHAPLVIFALVGPLGA